MSLGDAFAESEADAKSRAMYATWGHLYPELGCEYQGMMVFAVSTFSSDSCIVDFRWGDLPSSPVLYEDMYSWLASKAPDLEPGLYSVHGKYKKFKNENFAIVGTINPMWRSKLRKQL
jgi:hypothetical protein